jgi:hypothetical protein
MATIDWSDCPWVEVVPGKVSGAPLLKNTRLPVDAIIGNYDAFRDEGLSPDAATRKPALTPSRPFSTIAPSINFRRSLEGSVR